MSICTKITIPDDPVELLNNILKYFPKEYVMLRNLIGVGSVVYSNGDTVTAAIINTKPFTLMFGPKFLKEHMRTMEDLVFLLSHELTHLALDHLAEDVVKNFVRIGLADSEQEVMFRRATHILIDCQVNATCYHLLKNEKYMEFIKRYYSKTEMPYCFLRPDGEPDSDELKELHYKLYSERGITNEELAKGLLGWMQENSDKLKEVIKNLLGNHKDLFKPRATDAENDQLFDLAKGYVEDISNILERESNEGSSEENSKEKEGKGNKSEGCGNNGDNVRLRNLVELKEMLEVSSNISKELKTAYTVTPSARIRRAIDTLFPGKCTRTVIPNFYDTKTVIGYSMGHMPVFHYKQSVGSNVTIPCYVDVSGSQDHVIQEVLPEVSRQRRRLGDEVFCFSEIVSPTKIANLKEHYSTGGTNFNCIATHIIENNYYQALILTDGDSTISSDLVTKLKSRGVYIIVGWTVPNPKVDSLREVSKHEFFLFDRDRQW